MKKWKVSLSQQVKAVTEKMMPHHGWPEVHGKDQID
jgi:hypothetical protein